MEGILKAENCRQVLISPAIPSGNRGTVGNPSPDGEPFLDQRGHLDGQRQVTLEEGGVN